MQYGFERFLRFDAGLRRKYRLIAGSLVIAAVTFFIAAGGGKVMPTAVAVRVKSINLADASVQERYYFYGDAIKLFKDYPVTGAGGGGWTSVYRKYQSFLYHTTEVHSHLIQVLVETGVIGTLSLGAAMLLMWAQFGIVRAAERVGTEEVQGRGAGTVFSPVWRKALGIPLAAVSLNTGIAKAKAAMYDFQAGYAPASSKNLSPRQNTTLLITLIPCSCHRFTARIIITVC